MMLITMDGCYLIDRHFNFRRVQMRFPLRHTNEVCESSFASLKLECVVDGIDDVIILSFVFYVCNFISSEGRD